jgi:ElaB/YqjD/DUF883 family membrane-anchored ribosome-binding protein
MSIKAKKLKTSILKSGQKIGLLVEKDSPADRAITSSTTAAASLINDGEKQLEQVATSAKAKLDQLRAKIHAATAPRDKKK